MTKKAVEASPVIVSYKGFGSDWKCRDFQYAIGESYEQEGADMLDDLQARVGVSAAACEAAK